MCQPELGFVRSTTAMMSKVIIKSDHQRKEMNSVFRQVGAIIVTLQLSSFDLSLDIVLHDLFV